MIEVFTRKTGKDFAKVNWKERKKQLVRLFNSHWHNSSTVTGTILQQSLAQFFNRRWYNSLTVQQSVQGLLNRRQHDSSTVTGIILQQSLARMFDSLLQDCSKVTGTIVQQSLAWLFNTGLIVQQSLSQLFNSHWSDCSTVTDTIVQQSLARLLNSHWQGLSFFYFGRILQQWCSLLKNRVMYQEYNTWSGWRFKLRRRCIEFDLQK